ncbi:MAG: hypothetical protein ACJAVX_000758 [Pseudoalteromonas rhizosphaerae]|jgi:hypothetical protein
MKNGLYTNLIQTRNNPHLNLIASTTGLALQYH